MNIKTGIGLVPVQVMAPPGASSRTTDEWEQYLGEQVRNMRIRANLDQFQLASRAAISVGALKNLEGGKGSSLKTLIKVIRALNKTDWLEALAPTITVSPMQMLKSQSGQKYRVKVFRHRTPTMGKK